MEKEWEQKLWDRWILREDAEENEAVNRRLVNYTLTPKDQKEDAAQPNTRFHRDLIRFARGAGISVIAHARYEQSHGIPYQNRPVEAVLSELRWQHKRWLKWRGNTLLVSDRVWFGKDSINEIVPVKALVGLREMAERKEDLITLARMSAFFGECSDGQLTSLAHYFGAAFTYKQMRPVLEWVGDSEERAERLRSSGGAPMQPEWRNFFQKTRFGAYVLDRARFVRVQFVTNHFKDREGNKTLPGYFLSLLDERGRRIYGMTIPVRLGQPAAR